MITNTKVRSVANDRWLHPDGTVSWTMHRQLAHCHHTYSVYYTPSMPRSEAASRIHWARWQQRGAVDFQRQLILEQQAAVMARYEPFF